MSPLTLSTSSNVGRRRTTHLLIGVVLLAIASRLVFSLAIYPRLTGPLELGDDPDYFGQLTRNWLAGNGYVFYQGDPPTTFRGPGYPALIATGAWLFGDLMVGAVVLQSLIGGLLCVVVFLLGKECDGVVIGLIAALLIALYPLSIWYTPRLRYENLLGLLLAVAVLLMVRFQKSQSFRPALGAGIFLGMATLVNQIVMLLPLALLPAIVATAAQKMKAMALFALTPLAMLIVILPWTVRNYQVAGTIIPVHSGAITQFLKGSFEFENYHRAPLQLMELERMGREEMAKLLGLDVAAFDERTPGVDEALLPFALAYVREDPGRLLAKLAAQAPRFWYLSESPLKSRFLAVVQGVSLLLALVGTLAGLRRRNWSVLTLLLVIVYFNLVYAITHAQARYSTPLAPLVCVLAAAGLSLILAMTTRYRQPPGASQSS